MSNANDRQIGGTHYKQKDGGEEHWDRAARIGLDYWQACITKYVERCWDKHGVQDLEKARHFLDKYIEMHTSGRVVWEEGRKWTMLPPLPTFVEDDEVKAGRVIFGTDPEPVSPVEGRVAPTGWVGYLFEGADSQGFLFTCKSCDEKFYAPPNTDPNRAHAVICNKYPPGFLRGPYVEDDDGCEPGPGYVAQ